MKLYPFQEKAVEWLAKRPKAYLAAKMGLGKSGIILKTIEKVNAYPVLIVCPAIAKTHWKAEIDKWVPREFGSFDILSYEGAVKAAKSKTRKTYQTVVFDEAHYIKNPTSMRTKTLLLAKNALISNVSRFYFLSGTPTPNNVSELWPVLFAMGAVKERFYAFMHRYCELTKVWIGNGRSVTKVSGNFKERMPELKKRVKEHILQISYEQARIDMPQVIFSIFPIEGQLKIHDYREELAGAKVFDLQFKRGFGPVIDPLVAIQALAPSIASLRRIHALRKVEACVKLITEEIELGLYDKIIVFAHHQEVIENLHNGFAANKIASVYVHGGVPHEIRYNSIELFQKSPRCQVYIGSILASGTAVNLHATNQVLFLEQSFVPGENAQAIARAARIGQKEKTVNVRWLTLTDSGVDNRIADILMKKTADLKSFEE